jgi:hypothetical protein
MAPTSGLGYQRLQALHDQLKPWYTQYEPWPTMPNPYFIENVWRLNNGSDYLITLNQEEAANSGVTGYSLEGKSFDLFSEPYLSGMVPLYRCNIGGSHPHMLSSSSNCEGTYPFTRSLADRGIALCGSILRVMTRIRCPLA